MICLMHLKTKIPCAILAALCAAAFLTGGAASPSKCRHCGGGAYGSGCPYGPGGRHEHRGVPAACEFCGGSSYGSGCPYSPAKKHRHGGDGVRCIWCGGGAYGSGCPYSPTGRHEH